MGTDYFANFRERIEHVRKLKRGATSTGWTGIDSETVWWISSEAN